MCSYSDERDDLRKARRVPLCCLSIGDPVSFGLKAQNRMKLLHIPKEHAQTDRNLIRFVRGAINLVLNRKKVKLCHAHS